MQSLKEFQHNPDRVSYLLPWVALVAPSVVLNKDGSLMTVFRYRGPDLDSATESELISVSARLNNVLRRLGGGWAMYAEATRSESQNYPHSHWPDSVSRLIDEERKILFESTKHYESVYYLTFIFLPQSETASKIAATFVDTNDSTSLNYNYVLDTFQTEATRIEKLMLGVFPEVRRATDNEILTYLHQTVSDKSHPVTSPEIPMYLDSLLSDSPLLPGFRPKLGSKHLRVISLKAFPARSQPGLLDRLNRLGIEYRWSTRFIALEKTDAEAELSRYKKRWFSKRKGIVTLLKETITGSQSVMEDADAVNKARDADEALQELSEDLVSFGYFTTTIVLSHEDEKKLSVETREIERVINSLGFVTKIEDVNAVDAWLGTIPGNCRNNVRRPLLNSMNLSHLMPLSAVWAGQNKDEHFNAPPLFFAHTNGSTQFRYVAHVGDVGHTLVIGPTGAGKSVLLNLIEAQFRRYKDAQVYIFDKGGSAKVLTSGVGGDHYDLGASDSELNFQPLASIHEPSEKRWAHEWLLAILAQENVAATPAVKEHLWTALTSLATAPANERTIFGLSVLLQEEQLRQALQPYTIRGPHGHLLDSSKDTLRYSDWQCFEMEALMETPGVVMSVLSYLFHRLEQRFTGRPTLLVLDEAWLFLDNKAFSAKIREWLKVLRKANVMVLFATQSLADVDQSSIAETVREACFTKIYLPNANARQEQTANFYRKFGLNDRQLQILSEALPKRHYYYTSPLGNRLFELALDELSLAYCGATSKEKQTLVKELLAKSSSLSEFNIRYLEALNLDWAKNAYEALESRRNVYETKKYNRDNDPVFDIDIESIHPDYESFR